MKYSAYVVTSSTVPRVMLGTLLIEKGSKGFRRWDVVNFENDSKLSHFAGPRIAKICSTCLEEHDRVTERDHDGPCGPDTPPINLSDRAAQALRDAGITSMSAVTDLHDPPGGGDQDPEPWKPLNAALTRSLELERAKVKHLERLLEEAIRQRQDAEQRAEREGDELMAALTEVEAINGRISAELARLHALVEAADEFGDRHVIELREDGWTIAHPLSCRARGLFACPFNAAANDLAMPPAIGRFEVAAEDGRLVIGDLLDDGKGEQSGTPRG